MATILDVSKLAGVNASTVSRALNGSTKISEATRNRVLDAVKKLNYRTNLVAKSLKKGIDNSIGIVVPKYIPMMSITSSILEQAQKIAEEHNKFLFIAYYDNVKNSPYDAINNLVQHRCDGILYWHNHIYNIQFNEDHFSKFIADIDVPVVTLNIKANNNKDLHVLFNHKKSTQKIIDHLSSKGHTEIAFISATLASKISQWRLAGYLSGMKNNGIEYNPFLFIESGIDINNGYESCLELLKREYNFSALCCFNDKMAIGAAKAIRENDLFNNKNITFFGFGNDPILDWISPQINSVSGPTDEFIRSGMQLLLNEIENNTQKKEEIKKEYEGSLVIRSNNVFKDK